MKYLLLLLFTSLAINAQMLMTEAESIEKTKSSTLSLETLENNVVAELGSGFFIGTNMFITNRHVLSKFFERPKTKIRIKTSNGTPIVSELHVKKCGNENNIDLCLVEIIDDQIKAPNFLKFESDEVGKGFKVISIGHCGKESFKVKKGKILNVFRNFKESFGITGYTSNQNTEQLRTSLKSCPGDSGSAIISTASAGKVIAITTENFYDNSKQETYHLAITAKEILKFLNSVSRSPASQKTIPRHRTQSDGLSSPKNAPKSPFLNF